MRYSIAEHIVTMTHSSTIKEHLYESAVFKQNVSINTGGDFEVLDEDIEVNLKLDIPVHTFESFIITLLELRKDFNVACAYSKEPIEFNNNSFDKDHFVCEKNYTFTYWDSVYNNVLYSNKKANVFIYLSEFERYANLYVCKR